MAKDFNIPPGRARDEGSYQTKSGVRAVDWESLTTVMHSHYRVHGHRTMGWNFDPAWEISGKTAEYYTASESVSRNLNYRKAVCSPFRGTTDQEDLLACDIRLYGEGINFRMEWEDDAGTVIDSSTIQIGSADHNSALDTFAFSDSDEQILRAVPGARNWDANGYTTGKIWGILVHEYYITSTADIPTVLFTV